MSSSTLNKWFGWFVALFLELCLRLGSLQRRRGQNCKFMLSRMHKICGFYIIYFSIELKIGSSKTRCVFFFSFSLWLLLLNVTNFSLRWLQFFLWIMLRHFFFLTMTRKPSRRTHINATINRHDVLHPSEKSFATVHRVRLDLACHSFSTKVKGFLLQNFHILANQGILFTAYPAADT